MKTKLPNILLGINDKKEMVFMEQKEEKPIIAITGRSGMGMTAMVHNIEMNKGYKVINLNDRAK